MIKPNGTDGGPPVVPEGFVKNLKGGYDYSGLLYPESILSNKPLFGVYLGNLRATTVHVKMGKPEPFRWQAPHTVGCTMEEMPAMARHISKVVIQALAQSEGSAWGQTPVAVDFDVCYMPAPEELRRV